MSKIRNCPQCIYVTYRIMDDILCLYLFIVHEQKQKLSAIQKYDKIKDEGCCDMTSSRADRGEVERIGVESWS